VQKNNKRLRITGIKQLLVASIMLSVQIIVFFFSAGRIIDARPWIFFCASFLHYSVSTAVQYKFNPELLVQRLKRKRKGSKLWDEILMRVSNLVVLILIPVIAGLDVGRFLWSSLDIYFAVVGFVLFIVSTVLINWAMLVNPYFEPTVRIPTHEIELELSFIESYKLRSTLCRGANSENLNRDLNLTPRTHIFEKTPYPSLTSPV